MLTSKSSTVTDWPYSIREGYLLLFLAFVTLGVYYPAILGDFCFVDDIEDINWALNNSSPQLKDILFSANKYRRFLSQVLFYWFHDVFGAQAVHFHLANVLFHLLNGLLVYFLVKQLLHEDGGTLWPGLLAASFFLLHPNNVEAVAWIAGRNATIATLFVLFALNCHIRAQKDLKDWRLWVAGLFYFFSVLTYEIGLALLFFIVLLDLHERSEGGILQAAHNSYRAWLPYSVGILYFILPNLFAFFVGSGKESQLYLAVAGVVHAPSHKVLLNPIIGLGFYLKKMFFPWPLSFHIARVVKTPYFLVGLAFLVLLGYGIKKRRWEVLWGLGFLCGLLPVLYLTVRPFSWTPLAERYSYLASVFFAIFVGLFYAKHVCQRRLSLHSWAKVLPFVVVFVFGVGSAKRTPVWQSSEALLTDAYQKSNGGGWVGVTYGVMLLSQHREAEAEEYLQKALENGPVYRAAFGLGMLEESRGNYEKAEEYYLKAAWPSFKVHEWKRNLTPDVYKALARLHLSWATKDKEKIDYHYERSVHFFGRAYEFSDKDPMIRYNLCKVYLKQGDLERARDCFRQVWEEVPDTYYGKAAGKLMKVN